MSERGGAEFQGWVAAVKLRGVSIIYVSISCRCISAFRSTPNTKNRQAAICNVPTPKGAPVQYYTEVVVLRSDNPCVLSTSTFQLQQAKKQTWSHVCLSFVAKLVEFVTSLPTPDTRLHLPSRYSSATSF